MCHILLCYVLQETIKMKNILQRFEDLINQGNALRELHRDIHAKGDKEREDAGQQEIRWFRSCMNILKYSSLSEHESQFLTTAKGSSYPSYKFARLVGTLESARDEIKAGFVGNVRDIIHADIFQSLEEQAEELISTGHLTPAAVLARIVIERWLRQRANKANLTIGEKEKASQVIDKLKNSRELTTAKWRQVQSLLDIGNAAAHGKENEFDKKDVQKMTDFIKSDCIPNASSGT